MSASEEMCSDHKVEAPKVLYESVMERTGDRKKKAEKQNSGWDIREASNKVINLINPIYHGSTFKVSNRHGPW